MWNVAQFSEDGQRDERREEGGRRRDEESRSRRRMKDPGRQSARKGGAAPMQDWPNPGATGSGPWQDARKFLRMESADKRSANSRAVPALV
eukprot:3023709-Rhodomonas_salina.2